MDLRQQLEELEGRRSAAYQDTLGYWTIGVGRLIDARKGGGLSDVEINFLRDNDIAAGMRALNAEFPWFAGLNSPRQAVLFLMWFQLGLGGLRGFPRFLAAVRDERWALAGSEMLDSTWAKQTPSRVKRMALQMETGDWQ